MLGVAAFIAAVIIYVQTPKQPLVQQPQPVVVVKQPREPRVVVVKPTQWEFGGTAPGWTSGRWLGEGDFKHFGHMDHPFGQQPHYAGHPFHQQELPTAPHGPYGPPRH